MTKLTILLLLAVTSALAYTEQEHQSMFVQWMGKHKKKYGMEDLFHRFNIWKTNLAEIERRNKLGRSFTLAMNDRGDWTREEFRTYYTTQLGLPNAAQAPKPTHPAVLQMSNDSIDWRDTAVADIKYQGQCGGCWALSTAAACEGYGAIYQGIQINLSAQELIDCDKNNKGCTGGLPQRAYDYIRAHKGLSDWNKYPWREGDGQCQPPAQHFVPINGSRFCVGEDGIHDCLKRGPVAVLVNSDSIDFTYYSGGVFDDPSCSTMMDHGMNVVGMINYQGQPVWILKNSWGTQWGDGGFMYMIRGKGMCGINNTQNTLPL